MTCQNCIRLHTVRFHLPRSVSLCWNVMFLPKGKHLIHYLTFSKIMHMHKMKPGKAKCTIPSFAYYYWMLLVTTHIVTYVASWSSDGGKKYTLHNNKLLTKYYFYLVTTLNPIIAIAILTKIQLLNNYKMVCRLNSNVNYKVHFKLHFWAPLHIMREYGRIPRSVLHHP